MPSETLAQNTARTNCEQGVYDVDLLPHDPGKRKSMSSYPSGDLDAVRRGYIIKNPCQPHTHFFPQKDK